MPRNAEDTLAVDELLLAERHTQADQSSPGAQGRLQTS